VEKRCEIKSAILLVVNSAKRWNTSHSERASSDARGFIKNQQLSIPQIGTSQCPPSAIRRQKDQLLFKSATEHLFIAVRKLRITSCARLFSAATFNLERIGIFDPTYSDVARGGHLVAHEVLKDNADLTAEVLNAILAQVYAI